MRSVPEVVCLSGKSWGGIDAATSRCARPRPRFRVGPSLLRCRGWHGRFTNPPHDLFFFFDSQNCFGNSKFCNTPSRNEKHFLSLSLSLGTDILMKVFSLLSFVGKSGKFFNSTRKKQCIHHLVWLSVPFWHIPYGCGVLFICARFTRASNKINEIASHFFVLHINNILGAGWI